VIDRIKGLFMHLCRSRRMTGDEEHGDDLLELIV
jgi:hypothetical protein